MLETGDFRAVYNFFGLKGAMLTVQKETNMNNVHRVYPDMAFLKCRRAMAEGDSWQIVNNYPGTFVRSNTRLPIYFHLSAHPEELH